MAPSLLRSLRRWDLVAVVLNGVIGAGIFGLPSKVFNLSGTYSLLAFGACAICVSIIVLSFCEVASRFSGSGGPYLYARETFGATSGFTVGWLVWMARITSFAANCNLLPEHLDRFFPGAKQGIARALIITAVVGLLAWLNATGVRPAAHASNALAIGKLLPLAIFVIAGLFFLDPSRLTFGAFPGYQNFSKSVLLLVYAFTGFEMAVIPAGEARDPRKHLPAALMTGMATVVVFYVMIQVVCIGTLPGLAKSDQPLADAAASFAGTLGALMITAGIVISLAGNLNVLILAASRIIFAMGERGDLPRPLANIHPKYHTPVASILLTTAAMLALTLSGTFIYLVTLSTISRLVTYLATCVALPLLRRRPTAPPAVFRMPAGITVAVGGTALCGWLLSNTSLKEVRGTAIAAAVGLMLYGANRMVKRGADERT
jgi:APA family basic amino acid/polyamine antiporter